MTPSITVRLESVLHGLRDVIVPSINKEEILAVEQAGLILAQLSMVLRQLPYSDRYHRLCQNDARETAAEIVREPEGGPNSLGQAAALAQRLADPCPDPHAGYLALAAGIASLTTAAAKDGEPGWRARINAAVLAFSSRQNFRERIWFRDAGFDANPAELPDLQIYLRDAQAT